MKMTVLLDLCIGILYLFLGIFVWYQDKKNIINILFSLFCFSCGLTAILESITFILTITYGIYIRLLDNSRFIFFSLGILFAVHFFIHFPEKKRFFHHKLVYLFYLPLVYIIISALLGTYYSYTIISEYMQKTRNINYYIFAASNLLYIVTVLVILIKKFITIKPPIYKKQLKCLLIGVGAAIFIIEVFGLVPLCFNLDLKIGSIQLGPIILSIFIFYTILKYQAFDLKTIIQYSLFRFFALLLILIPVVALPGFFYKYTVFLPIEIQLLLWGILCVLYILLINYAVIPKLNQIVLKRKKILTLELELFHKRMNTIKNQQNLQSEVFHIINSSLYVNDLVLLTPDHNLNYTGTFEVSNNFMEIGQEEVTWLQSFSCVLNNRFFNDAGEKTAFLRRAGIALIIPLRDGDVCCGLLVLCNKRNRKSFIYEEIKFLNQLGTVIAALLNKFRLEKVNKQKENFLVNIAHETKTPLTIICNYLEKDIQQRGSTDEIMIVKQNVSKLSRDLVNYLDLEKLNQGRIFYNHDQIINFSHMVKTKVIYFTEIAKRKNITLKSTLADNLYTTLDPYAGDRIVNNLMDNAIKFTQPGGCVFINLSEKDNTLLLIIRDTGIGMSMEEQKNIFMAYFQGADKKRNIQGIGVGLSIVHKIIEEVKGNIYVESEINKGTTLTVVLGKHHQIPEQNTDSCIRYSIPPDYAFEGKVSDEIYIPGRASVLIVEDNSQLLAYLQHNLSLHYNVFCSKNGLHALNMIDSMPIPDLIISDIMMDVMDGYDFFRNIKSNKKFSHIPFIFLTVKSSFEDKMTGIKEGAVDFIVKPFVIDELKGKIRSIINNKQAQREVNICEMEAKISGLLRAAPETPTPENISQLHLTNREQDVVGLLLQGYEYKEISCMLNISINTLKPYITQIYNKLEVHNKVELVNKIKGYSSIKLSKGK